MLQTLIKRLEIIRAAMSLADEDLIAQQLPALRAVLPQLDGAAGETRHHRRAGRRALPAGNAPD